MGAAVRKGLFEELTLNWAVRVRKSHLHEGWDGPCRGKG